MLTILLALVVGLGSFALYMSAFFYPEVYRKGDLIWSGVGLFYALVLWICADRITGGVLLGQMASVSLIGWFGWQTLTARLGHTPTPSELQEKISEALKPENRSQLIEQAKQQFSGVREQVQTLLNKAPSESQPAAPAAQPYKPLTREDFGNPPAVETTSEAVEPASEAATTATPAPKTDVKGAITNAGKAFSGLFKKPEKNKTTYVRKDYREAEQPKAEQPAEATDNDFDFEDDAVTSEKAVEEKTVPVNQDGASESTIEADEVIQEEVAYEAAKTEPVPPNPPAPELVDAAVADAEAKQIEADPPETSDESKPTNS